MCTPLLHVHVCLIKISQASFFPCRQPLTISSSAFSSLHSVICALNKSRSTWTLTRAFACANTRADVMRVCTPSNMVPIMCLSFSKLNSIQLWPMNVVPTRAFMGRMYSKMNELAEQHHYSHCQMSQMIRAAFFNISQEQGQSKRPPVCRRVFTRDLPWGGNYQAIYRSCITELPECPDQRSEVEIHAIPACLAAFTEWSRMR